MLAAYARGAREASERVAHARRFLLLQFVSELYTRAPASASMLNEGEAASRA